MGSSWIAFLGGGRFLRNDYSIAQFVQCNDIGIGFFIFGPRIPQTNELILNCLCLGKNFNCGNKYPGVTLCPFDQSRCSDHTNFLFH